MGIFRGPNIVRDGLVLQLDAANTKSYSSIDPGSTWYDLSGNNFDFTLDSSGITHNSNGYFTLADGGASDQVVTSITKRVNGGTIGLPDRIKHFKEYYHLLA